MDLHVEKATQRSSVTLPPDWSALSIHSVHESLVPCEACGRAVWLADVVALDGPQRAWVDTLFADPIEKHTPARCRAIRGQSSEP